MHSSKIYGDYDVLYREDKVGTLRVRQRGLMTEFDCLCTYKAGRVLRLMITSGSTRRDLGVMLPDGEKLKFNKRYSKNGLKQMSINFIEAVYLIDDEETSITVSVDNGISSSFNNKNDWLAEVNPQNLFYDQQLRQACKSVKGALIKHLSDGCILLALPFNTGEPFPLIQIFCFGESMSISGKNYLVFRLKDGNLVT